MVIFFYILKVSLYFNAVVLHSALFTSVVLVPEGTISPLQFVQTCLH